jgi:hypothetical protein
MADFTLDAGDESRDNKSGRTAMTGKRRQWRDHDRTGQLGKDI